MYQEIKDEILDPSLQPDSNPRYTIKNNAGVVINDNVQIDMKTPILQNPTPLNKVTLSNIQGDLYTQDRYVEATLTRSIMAVNYATDLITSETRSTTNFLPQTWTASDNTTQNYTASDGTKLYASKPSYDANTIPSKAFDRNTSTRYQASGSGYAYIKITLPKALRISKFKTYITNSSDFSYLEIEGSNNDSTWKTLYKSYNEQNALTEIPIDSQEHFKYYRIGSSGDGVVRIADIQVAEYYSNAKYGEYKNSYKINLPLTSYEKNKIVRLKVPEYSGEVRYEIEKTWTNITPADGLKYSVHQNADGVKITASDMYDDTSSYASYLACDGDDESRTLSSSSSGSYNLTLEFPNAIRITAMKLYYDADYISNVQIQASTNNSSWTTLKTLVAPVFKGVLTLSNTTAYKYYRLNFNKSYNDNIYVYEWDVARAYTSQDVVENPYLNINSLGEKKIEAIVRSGQELDLVYNGSAWIAVSDFVTGQFVMDSETKKITLGFTPRFVIVYSSFNNNRNVAYSTATSDYRDTPRVLSQAHVSIDGGGIVKNGFVFRGSGTSTNPIYYVAYR